ncbi:LysE family translocator [Halobacillus sp. A5]|uniref:LysE family translocator n=1 Tax=Halobacillus sp. A5 TaxID=2880263 RepID=UPI0020A690D6|nr:LysE family translocator [Halobacillus sp. A5]MCP3027730.1 LysE family translocator [Halobacillus sp. A5]
MKKKSIYLSLFLLMFTLSVITLNLVNTKVNNLFVGIQWAALIPAAFIMASIPGANQILSLRNGLRKGAKTAIIAVTGRFTAFALMVMAVSFGLHTILHTSTIVFTIIKWVGVIYLGWLGVKTILTSRNEYDDEQVEGNESTRGPLNAWYYAKQEFMVAAANPKALLLFTVFLPQFISPDMGDAGGQILIAGAVYILIEFICATVYATVGGELKSIGLSGRVKRNLDRLTGGVMIALAAWLSTDKR